jgi:hypothetical protein
MLFHGLLWQLELLLPLIVLTLRIINIENEILELSQRHRLHPQQGVAFIQVHPARGEHLDVGLQFIKSYRIRGWILKGGKFLGILGVFLGFMVFGIFLIIVVFVVYVICV